jgi:glycosyltransferase involved in cell wall biosynthesis
MDISAAHRISMREPIICHLTDFSPEVPGSFIESLLFLIQYCQKHLQLDTVCLFPTDARERPWLAQLERMGLRHGFVPRKRNVIREARSVLQPYAPLIFHSHFVTFDFSAGILSRFFYRPSQVIWHLHSLEQSSFPQRLRDCMKVKLLGPQLVDRLIAVGEGVFQSALNRGFAPERVLLIHNAINLDRFRPNTEGRQRIRQQLQVADACRIFLFLGWSPLRKGVDLFVKAIEALRQTSDQSALFLIVGGDETKVFVSQMAASSRVAPVLRVIDPIDDFQLLLNGVDAFVSASRSEGLSYAVLEAMAAGKLIISSDISGVRETYGKAKGVWLFPSEDWRGLATLMGKFMETSVPEREWLGHKNMRYVGEHHSLESWAERVGTVYKSLLAG